MKVALTILILLALALATVFVLALVAVMVNEETHNRCGTCIYFDRDLRICWKAHSLPSKEEYTKGCNEYTKVEEKEK